MFNIDYASIFQNLPPEFSVVLIAMLPIAELRVAIPVGIEGLDLAIATTFIWSVIGNLIPVIFLLLWLDPISRWLMRNFKIFDRFFNWVFARTRRRFTSNAAKYGTFITLVLFVAIPLPITGAWTGSAAAFLFGIPFKKAFLAISVGVLIAGMIVSLATVGISLVI